MNVFLVKKQKHIKSSILKIKNTNKSDNNIKKMSFSFENKSIDFIKLLCQLTCFDISSSQIL